MGDENKAEEIYETILSFPGEENNPAILNNLSNIKKAKGKIKEAFDLIQKAKKKDSEDEIIDRNYQNLLGIIKEQEAIEQNYKNAIGSIQKENDFVIGKLKNFFTNIKKEHGLKNNQVAIPNWKFKVLMGTDDQKAESLKKNNG
jgi:tetratricopeptide (TPR) repeat protein